uniref:Uncharacterized protein n=1 Tax=Anopheles quadriannulatus TaxID=34691 RepID=A0A182XU56_ANOQN
IIQRGWSFIHSFVFISLIYINPELQFSILHRYRSFHNAIFR